MSHSQEWKGQTDIVRACVHIALVSDCQCLFSVVSDEEIVYAPESFKIKISLKISILCFNRERKAYLWEQISLFVTLFGHRT